MGANGCLFVREQKYNVREHSETIYASADKDPVTHMQGAGDVDAGKAWKSVRRPSDMVRALLVTLGVVG